MHQHKRIRRLVLFEMGRQMSMQMQVSILLSLFCLKHILLCSQRSDDSPDHGISQNSKNLHTYRNFKIILQVNCCVTSLILTSLVFIPNTQRSYS